MTNNQLNVELVVPENLSHEESLDLLKAVEHQLGLGDTHHDAEGAGWHPDPKRAALEMRWVNALDWDWLYAEVCKVLDIPLAKAMVESPYGKVLDARTFSKIDKVLAKFFGQKWLVLIEESIRLGIAQNSPLAPRVLPELLAREQFWVHLFVSTWLRKFGQDIAYGVAQDVVTAARHRFPPRRLAFDLRDRFQHAEGGFQRDWRRVAITESNRLAETGRLSTHDDGVLLLGQSYPTACRECKELVHGKVFRKVTPPKGEPTDFEKQHLIWVGKSNFGLRRADWSPCVSVHPLCRCFFSFINPENWWVDSKGVKAPKRGMERSWQQWLKSQWFKTA